MKLSCRQAAIMLGRYLATGGSSRPGAENLLSGLGEARITHSTHQTVIACLLEHHLPQEREFFKMAINQSLLRAVQSVKSASVL